MDFSKKNLRKVIKRQDGILMDIGEIRSEVSKLAEKFKENYPDFNASPIGNSIEAAEKLGFFVVSIPAPYEISGYTRTQDEKSMIFVNANHNLGRQYYSICHEIYHWYTGDGNAVTLIGSDEYSETEMKAELFASEILMDREKVLDELEKISVDNLDFIRIIEIIKLQYIFNVSYVAMLRRLITLFPQNKKSLSKRYGITKDPEKLLKTIKEQGYSGDLELPTKKIYISPSLFYYMESNIEQGKLSPESIKDIVSFIEKEL